jgi:hypothetical protein
MDDTFTLEEVEEVIEAVTEVFLKRHAWHKTLPPPGCYE